MNLARSLLALSLATLAACAGACAGSATAPTGTPTTPAATGTAAPSATAGAVATGTITPEPSATPTAPAPPTASPTGTPPPPGGTATVPATPAAPDPIVRLKYRLFDRFGRLWYCDPDYYPVARADETDLAREHSPEIQADAPTFSAILDHLGIAVAGTYTADRQLAIYRDWKMLRALTLERIGAAYAFNARFSRDESTGVQAEGTIDASGTITIASESPAGRPNCPICLARGTHIATPDGPIAVEALRTGMRIWTASTDGAPVVATVIAVGSTTAPPDHEVVHLVLADGRALRVSPGHPLADGRTAGEVAVGDDVDGATVVRAEREPYGGGTTFDLLPSGATATYWADGVLLQSTLH